MRRRLPALLVALGVCLAAPPAALGATYTVNSVDDTNDGVCDATSCTLREAIETINAGPFTPPETINFDIAGPGPHTIVTAGLPAIGSPVTIDGTSEPDYDAAAGQPAVELVGPGPGSATVGLNVSAPPSFVRGLSIGGFSIGIYSTVGGVFIEGNRIGLNAAGTQAVSNNVGIHIESGPGSIGGSTPADRNVISQNVARGIQLQNGSVIVQGNYIGTDATGAQAEPNGEAIALFGGSDNAIRDNVISGNLGDGIVANGAVGTAITGNRIGSSAVGTAPLGNQGFGVTISGGGGATIGGSTNGNLIAFNASSGVVVDSGTTGVLVMGNSIHSNERFLRGFGLGIDLERDGVTENDPGDADEGANRGQNTPVVSSAITSGDDMTVRGTLDSMASRTFNIDVYASAECDPSGNGEGQFYLGRTSTTTDGSGFGTYTAILNQAAPVGFVVTATAIDPESNTSEFSACTSVTEPDGAAVPAPVRGSRVNVAPVSGVVRVRAPDGRFVVLRAGQQIPVGWFVDTTRGVVRLTSAANARGATQTATFRDGIFRTRQKRSAGAFTELKLAGPLKGCRGGRATAAARRGRRLWGNGKGRFRSVGNRASAGVRGTRWLVQDRCDRSTLVVVKQGRVTVRDFARRKTIQLRAGQRYVAKPRRRR
jgi:CSLREA domain-containing protein